jgi:hypothetical protein
MLDPVIAEEKVDGSQLSFGRFGGELKIRSHHKDMEPDAPEEIFKPAVDTIKDLDLKDGWTYRGEAICKPKHNALAYDRTPKGWVILFDINTDEECYLSYAEKKQEAERLGLEVVPLLYEGLITEQAKVLSFLDTVSVLGGQKIEGVVIKNYARFGVDKKCLMGKYVSEAFKEVHRAHWGESNPAQNDILARLITMYKTPARWDKAAIHLKEQGIIEDDLRAIGKLIPEVRADVEKECADEIKTILFKWAMPHVARGVTGGLPEWWKKKIMVNQFGTEANDGAITDGGIDSSPGSDVGKADDTGKLCA